ncbi:hypothetical protein EMIHUDRAFT_455078 [Emiliania huxleyi CCMP1516]|uniref:Uncharacterized protein n=4 Tax=Emiliania huxleyi TaxID=2903 RepID=A0A0D3KKT8_EMIH1|nr:hypothetical protein EMIHUDRAFT_455078 [Emiliania huxleyi CCMP1516]EOD36373.1 hypothetical protein EMIHUDRAFT_455078 [Emiliania huxleyi CCMP1516]|eukprot:XP_005788802.1 hypothetical protein EMIHUDRAFT_455078 [Emiliania huxleyi CCMP1516]
MPDENVTEGLSGSKDGEAARQKMQIKSFTAWVNLHLKQAGMAVENLKTDFGDGIKLLRLVEIISEEELGKYNQNPVSKFQKVENLNIPLKYINSFLKEIGIRNTYSAENIIDEAYRPDLVQYQKLNKSAKVDNLNHAFDLANDKLEIPKLLDATDMVSMRPDEKSVMTYVSFFWKSVMTYVSFFWKVFAANKRKKIAAERITNVLQRELAYRDLMEQYKLNGEQLGRWIKLKTDFFQAEPNCNSQAELEVEMKKHVMEYGRGETPTTLAGGEKPTKLNELNDLEALHSSITSRLASLGRTFIPTEDTSLKVLNRWWEELTYAEQAYEANLRLKLKNLKRVEYYIKLHHSKASKLEDWLGDKERWLGKPADAAANGAAAAPPADADETPPAGPVPRKSSFVGMLKSTGSSFGNQVASPPTPKGQRASKGVKVVPLHDGPSESVADVQAKLNMLTAHNEELSGRQATVPELDKLLAKIGELGCPPMRQFSLTNRTSVIKERQVAEIDGYRESLEALQCDLDAIAAYAEEMGSMRISRNPYSRFGMPDLLAHMSRCEAALEARQVSVQEALAHQQQIDATKKAFAAAADAILEFVKAERAQLDEVAPPGLVIQPDDTAAIEKGKAMGSALDALMAPDAKEGRDAKLLPAQELSDKLMEAAELDNPYTAQTIMTLKTQIDLLDKVLRDKRSFVEGQLARAQAEITSEQYEEIKKVFYHFDKSKDGLLNQLEFAAAIKAMDFEIADHEQEPTFLRFAKEGQRAEEPAAMTIDLSGFTTFVLQQYKDNDTKDTLFAAFETVANGKDTLSAEDIRAAIPQEEADYLLSQLELKDGDHGLEYKKFTEAIYGGT